MSNPPSLPPAADNDFWIIKTKALPYWKFMLGNNYFSKYQLKSVSWNGSELTVEVNSGKIAKFSKGNFTAKFIKGQYGLRDFTIKSHSKPATKVVFRETLFQMPEEDWDNLTARIGAAESGLSRVLNVAKNFADDYKDSGSVATAAANQIPLEDLANKVVEHVTSEDTNANQSQPTKSTPKKSSFGKGCLGCFGLIAALFVLLIIIGAMNAGKGKHDFEKNREKIISSMKSALERNEFDKAISIGEPYELVEDYELQQMLIEARVNLESESISKEN